MAKYLIHVSTRDEYMIPVAAASITEARDKALGIFAAASDHDCNWYRTDSDTCVVDPAEIRGGLPEEVDDAEFASWLPKAVA
jgi:hypothetical protein